MIFDEVQHAPDLLSYSKPAIDKDRNRRGRFALMASRNLLLSEKIMVSLAGRTGVLTLYPLSWREREGRAQRPLPWGPDSSDHSVRRTSLRELSESFLIGGFPGLVSQAQADPCRWHSSYLSTYLERDARSLRHVGDRALFVAFVEALASRSGQLTNLTDISRDLGVAVNTVRAWLSVLEATHQIVIVRPYFANVGKRLVKRPKVTFTDTGTLCSVTGLRDRDHAARGPMACAIFETAVLAEIFQVLAGRGCPPRVYCWRTAAGTEVDFLVRSNGKLVPVGAKLSATPRPGMGRSIQMLQRDLGDAALPGCVVYPGDTRMERGRGVTALPFAEL